MKSKQEKIICLGKEFASEEERREYFRNELRKKLPELKKIEGFNLSFFHIGRFRVSNHSFKFTNVTLGFIVCINVTLII